MKMKKDQANSILYALIFKLMISKDFKLKSPSSKNEQNININQSFLKGKNYL